MLIPQQIQLQQLETKLKHIEKKRDKIAIQIAKTLNLPNVWDMGMVDWTNPQIQDLKTTYFELEDEQTRLYWEVRELEAYMNGDIEKVTAERTVSEFLESQPIEKVFEYMKHYDLTSHRLIEKVIDNPDYIEETYGVKA